jgi:hypothetical protein
MHALLKMLADMLTASMNARSQIIRDGKLGTRPAAVDPILTSGKKGKGGEKVTTAVYLSI